MNDLFSPGRRALKKLFSWLSSRVSKSFPALGWFWSLLSRDSIMTDVKTCAIPRSHAAATIQKLLWRRPITAFLIYVALALIAFQESFPNSDRWKNISKKLIAERRELDLRWAVSLIKAVSCLKMQSENKAIRQLDEQLLLKNAANAEWIIHSGWRKSFVVSTINKLWKFLISHTSFAQSLLLSAWCDLLLWKCRRRKTQLTIDCLPCVTILCKFDLHNIKRTADNGRWQRCWSLMA